MSNIMGFFYWNSSPEGTDFKINLFNISAVRFCILKRLESIGKKPMLKLIVCSGIFCQTVISSQWWPDTAHAKWLQWHCWTLATDTCHNLLFMEAEECCDDSQASPGRLGTADPPPARLVTQPPTGSAAAATNPHSGKTNASHAQLMMGGLPFLSTFLWFYELLHALFTAVISLSWRLCCCPACTGGDWPGPASHVPHVPLSQIQIIHHAVSTFACAESRNYGTYI